jgi:PITH domain
MDPPECSGHSHDHDHGDDPGLSLRQYIEFVGVACLNEEVQFSGQHVLKRHEDRLSDTPSVRSPEGDPELILHIPFTEAVTIQSITIRNASSSTETASPRRIKLFTNREDLDFEAARELPPQQEIELLPPDHFVEGTIDYPTRPAGRFQSISSLTLFVVNNYDDSGESGTEITFVGLKGRGTRMKRMAVETVYESQGMMKDHQVGDEFRNPDVL